MSKCALRNFVLLLLVSALVAGCAALDGFLDSDQSDSPLVEAPKQSQRRVPIPPTIQDYDTK